LILPTSGAKQKGPDDLHAQSILDNMRLDMHITSMPEFAGETSLPSFPAILTCTFGTAARPAIVGRVNHCPKAMFFFNGTKYRLERVTLLSATRSLLSRFINLDMSARVQVTT